MCALGRKRSSRMTWRMRLLRCASRAMPMMNYSECVPHQSKNQSQRSAISPSFCDGIHLQHSLTSRVSAVLLVGRCEKHFQVCQKERRVCVEEEESLPPGPGLRCRQQQVYSKYATSHWLTITFLPTAGFLRTIGQITSICGAG